MKTSEQKHYTVYQVGGPIYGVGLNQETALIDAQQWMDEQSKNEDGNIIVQDDNTIDGNLCLAECSEEVFLKYNDEGGDFRYIANGTRSNTYLYLPKEIVVTVINDVSGTWRTK